MANNNDETDVPVVPIPKNFEGGLNFMGFSLNGYKLMEGAVYGAVFGYLFYEFAYWVLVIDDLKYLILAGALGLIAGVGLGLVGRNGTFISVYLMNAFSWLLHRRTAYYNPRVKYEATYALDLSEEEKASHNVGVNSNKAYKSVAEQARERFFGSGKTAQQHIYDTPLFFKDDIGVVGNTPEELMKASKKKHVNRKKPAKNASEMPDTKKEKPKKKKLFRKTGKKSRDAKGGK